METFSRYIGCDDCQEQWTPYCPICKQKGQRWKDENGRNVPKHQLTEKSKTILLNTKKNIVVIENRIITPPPVKKRRITLNNKKKIIVPDQPLPITWENFFIATRGTFDEIENMPNGFESFFKFKGSVYFINKDKSVLVRKSDHWGSRIRYCNWFLKGYGFQHCSAWKKQEEPVKIGIIKIADLKPFNQRKYKNENKILIKSKIMKTGVQEYQDNGGKNRIRAISEENGNKLVAVTQGYGDMDDAQKAVLRSGVAFVEKYASHLLNMTEVQIWKDNY